MAEDCDKAPVTNKGGDVEKAGSKQASPAPQQKAAGGAAAAAASPNKAAGTGKLRNGGMGFSSNVINDL